MTKECKKCGEEKALEEFGKNKATKDGIHNYCKSCCRANVAAYSAANPDKVKSNAKAAYQANIDKRKAVIKVWREVNPDKVKSQRARYKEKNRVRINLDQRVRSRESYKANPDKFNSRRKARYHANPDKHKATCKAWTQRNMDKVSVYQSNRRAKKLSLTHPLHNPATELILRQMTARLNSCLGIRFEVDHIWPLNKGGYHHHENLQIITKSINCQKNDNLNFYHPSIKSILDLPKWLQKEIIVNAGTDHYQEIKTAIQSIKSKQNQLFSDGPVTN